MSHYKTKVKKDCAVCGGCGFTRFYPGGVGYPPEVGRCPECYDQHRGLDAESAETLRRNAETGEQE